MNLTELKAQVALGEDSRRQFKQDATNADALAGRIRGLAICEGGLILRRRAMVRCPVCPGADVACLSTN